MGGWDIYYAICGGPFSSQVEMDPEGTEEDSYRYDVLKHCDLGCVDGLCALGVNPDGGEIDKFVIICLHNTGHALIVGFKVLCYWEWLLLGLCKIISTRDMVFQS